MKPLLHPKTDTAVQALAEAPPQAILMVGKSGAGKQTLATFLAANLLQVDPAALEHHAYFSLVGDSEGTISIDAIRDVQHFLSRKATSTAAINRIAVIVGAERLTTEAQNAFLKTLEEPPIGSILILTVSDQQRLLPTIVSRVHALEVITPDSAAVRGHFMAAGFAAAQVDRALLMSGGLPGLMAAILQGESEHPLVKAADTARALLRLDTFGRLALLATLSKQRQQCLDVLFILQQMADLSLNAPGKSPSTYKQWQTVLQQAYDAEQALSTQAQPKLVLTNLILSL